MEYFYLSKHFSYLFNNQTILSPYCFVYFDETCQNFSGTRLNRRFFTLAFAGSHHKTSSLKMFFLARKKLAERNTQTTSFVSMKWL